MAIAPKIWAELRAAYESGAYKSVEQLHTEFNKKLLKNCPSLQRIREKCAEEKWSKKACFKEMFRESFEKAGITTDHIVGKVNTLLNAKKAIIIPSNNKEESGMIDFVEDAQAIDKGIKHYTDLVGAKTEEVNVSHSFPTEIKINIITPQKGDDDS